MQAASQRSNSGTEPSGVCVVHIGPSYRLHSRLRRRLGRLGGASKDGPCVVGRRFAAPVP